MNVCCLLLASLLVQSEAEADLLAPYREKAIERWQEDIDQLVALDQETEVSDDAVMFVGSSSIRLWESMSKDMQPWKTVRRGYGGARFSDLCVFLDRLIEKQRFQAMVIFVGNDISGGESDESPEKVLKLFQHAVQIVHRRHPAAPVFFITVTPTVKRYEAWPKIHEANELVREYCEATTGLFCIDTQDQFLDDQGKPLEELFRDDMLHLNADGYALWTKIIKKSLAQHLEEPNQPANLDSVDQ